MFSSLHNVSFLCKQGRVLFDARVYILSSILDKKNISTTKGEILVLKQ